MHDCPLDSRLPSQWLRYPGHPETLPHREGEVRVHAKEYAGAGAESVGAGADAGEEARGNGFAGMDCDDRSVGGGHTCPAVTRAAGAGLRRAGGSGHAHKGPGAEHGAELRDETCKSEG